MPDRAEVMLSVQDYLRARERANEPTPVMAAYAFGTCLLFTGAAAIGLSLIRTSGLSGFLLLLGFSTVQLGAIFVLLGRNGRAPHRVTETTRYPQQTGDIHDLYFQILGEDYLWVVVAMMALWLILFAML